MEDKDRANRRLDQLWVTVCASAFLDAVRGGSPHDQAADAAVKLADAAEDQVSKRPSMRHLLGE